MRSNTHAGTVIQAAALSRERLRSGKRLLGRGERGLAAAVIAARAGLTPSTDPAVGVQPASDLAP